METIRKRIQASTHVQLFFWDAHNQLLAAPRPAPLNHGATVFTLHPGSKTVSSFSANSTGLIRSLGHDPSPYCLFITPDRSPGNFTNRIINHDLFFLSRTKAFLNGTNGKDKKNKS